MMMMMIFVIPVVIKVLYSKLGKGNFGMEMDNFISSLVRGVEAERL